MKTSHADQTANSAKGSPARHGVTSSDSSLAMQSEKTLVEHSEEAITSPPRGFWRRILDRLSGSKHSSSSKGSPPLPDQPEKTHRSPTPAPQNGRWVKSTTTCTVERGYIPSRHQYKYGFTRHYSPVERVTSRTIASAPWLIEVALYSNTVAGLVDALSRCTEALHLCWYDKISVMNRSIAKKKKSYARVIRLGYVSPDGSRDWATCFIIWHDDPQWLDGLSYSDMRGMLLRRLLIR
ncbi:hypothetical protein B0I37DRAFT_85017 [Chaetomium sp. MPI-CAGE-AT-0009]|nr:hypothetical protein B0I37DRAFT_85017 [Chaetomium sp. MPI-CAGE-AT-0009]